MGFRLTLNAASWSLASSAIFRPVRSPTISLPIVCTEHLVLPDKLLARADEMIECGAKVTEQLQSIGDQVLIRRCPRTTRSLEEI
jgi:hypothetical protein